MNSHRLPFSARQRGMMTLLVGIIILVLMMLMAVSSYNMTRTNAAISGNSQNKLQATNAALQVTEQVISSTTFTDTPANSIPNNTASVDINGDGTADVTVTLNPVPCIKKIQVIKNSELNVALADDQACIQGTTQNLGISGSASGDSLCANSLWEINARAGDAVTQASSTVTTGVTVRVTSDSALDTSKACL